MLVHHGRGDVVVAEPFFFAEMEKGNILRRGGYLCGRQQRYAKPSD